MPTDEELRRLPRAPLLFGAAAPLPPTADLSSTLPEPGDQGNQESCVAWVVSYGARSYYELQARQWPDYYNNEQLFSPSYVYNQIRRSKQGCDSPTSFDDAFAVLTTQGVLPLSAFPYDPISCDRLPDADMRSAAGRYKIDGADVIYPVAEGVVKASVAKGDPVLIGMYVAPDVLRDLPRGSIYQGGGSANLVGHAMLVAGYDDNRGAFKVLNSWGADWADGGYGWISYAEFGRNVPVAFVLKPSVPLFGASPEASDGDPLVTVTTRRLRRIGPLTESLGTGNHHCSSNCAGEPTRTNYKLQLRAAPGRVLRDPRLICRTGPCHGWNAVVAVRLEDQDRVAVASWDVWSTPTTWEFVADEYETYVAAETTQRLSPGAELNVPVVGTDASTELSVKSGNRELAIRAGEPELTVNGVGIALGDTKSVRPGETVLTYRAVRKQ